MEVEARLEIEWEALLEEAASRLGASPLALSPRDRMPLSRIALFAQLEEVREAFRELRLAIDPELAGRYVNASWTLHDLLAHLASWAGEFRREVETVSRGGSFDYAIPFAMTVAGPNQWNEEQVQERRGRKLETIFAELDEETRRLQELLLGMPEGDLYRSVTFPLAPTGDPRVRWQGPSALIIAGKCLHDRHHIAQVRARLERWKG